MEVQEILRVADLEVTRLERKKAGYYVGWELDYPELAAEIDCSLMLAKFAKHMASEALTHRSPREGDAN